MEQIILIFHILLAVALVALVLLQKGKGAGMGVAFGSGASQTVFGSRGSVGFLLKLTIFIAALFFTTSIALTYLASQSTKQNQTTSVLTGIENISKIQKERIKAPPVENNISKKKTAS